MKLAIPDEYFDDEALTNTERRWDRFISEWMSPQEIKFTVFENVDLYDQLIIDTGSDFSLCSHHCLPIKLKYYIGYIPNDKLCGLSKIARVVNHYAHRPQMQEKLTEQIADFLEVNLSPKGVIVIIEGEHFCKSMRGVKTVGNMTTSSVRGMFKTNIQNCKEEFIKLAGVGNGRV